MRLERDATNATGASLIYDAERRLKYWRIVPDGQPITSQTWFMDDGDGHRIERNTSGGLHVSDAIVYTERNNHRVTGHRTRKVR